MELAWYLIILLCLSLYVLLDGYDLGIGVLSLAEPDDRRKLTMHRLVATVWDGNETWLILAAVALWGGLPQAYATALPPLYVPLLVMLFALIIRGFSFEMQEVHAGYTRRWGLAFGLGSLLAAFSQGVVLGAVLEGLPRLHSAPPTDAAFGFLTLYSVLTGVLVVAAYAVAGAAWLVYKTNDHLCQRAARTARFGIPVVILLAAVNIAVYTWHVSGSARPTGAQLWIAVILCIVGVLLLGYAALRIRPETSVPQLFLAVAAAEVCGLAALVIARHPVVISPDLTLKQAASPTGSLNFLLIGVGLCVPIVMAYNAYAYWVFRGKFSDEEPEATVERGRHRGAVAAEDHLVTLRRPLPLILKILAVPAFAAFWLAVVIVTGGALEVEWPMWVSRWGLVLVVGVFATLWYATRNREDTEPPVIEAGTGRRRADA